MRKLAANCILNQATRLIICIPILLTTHVETVCLLSQRKPNTTIEVDLDISELEVSSAETKATYEEIKSYVLKENFILI